MDKDHGLVIDMRSNATSGFVDMTGHHNLFATGDIQSSLAQVDASLITPNKDALVHLKLHTNASSDVDDTITKTEVTGLAQGTVLSDGTHTYTVGSITDKYDISNWDHQNITAQLSGHSSQNMNIGVIVTTTGPDGKTAVSVDHEALVLDPNAPIPDANITGDDNKTTDEDTAVSGVLNITDSDASQAHFDTTPIKGQYGTLTMSADGHWKYTPDNRANALNDGDKVNETLLVHSADGTAHQVHVHITGKDEVQATPPAPLDVNIGQIIDSNFQYENQQALMNGQPVYMILGMSSNGVDVNWEQSGIKSISLEGHTFQKSGAGFLYLDGQTLNQISQNPTIYMQHRMPHFTIEFNEHADKQITLLASLSEDPDGSYHTWASHQSQITPPVVSHDEAEVTPDEINIQLDTDLADANHHIATAMQEVNDLKANGQDVSEVQAKLEEFTQIKQDIEAQKEALHEKDTTQNDADKTVEQQQAEEHMQTDVATVQVDTHHEATSSIVPEHDTQMPSLDNIAEHLQTTKTATPEVPHEALATVAILLGDTQTQGADAKIIKAVETQATKEHVANPDAPAHDANTVNHAHDVNAVDHDGASADYAPDAHHHIVDDQDMNDGTGLTS